MALYESAEIVTATAGAAITRYDAVLIMTADRSAFPVDDIDGGGILGIAQETVAAGDSVPVCVGGVSKVNAAGTITRGAKIGSNTSGKAVALASGSRMVGIALWGAASGDIIPALVNIGEKKA